ncbi:hypothetical protein GN956_G20690 [Arapaima gigas]
MKLVLLITWITLSALTELSAAVEAEDRFGQKGGSVHLTVDGQQKPNLRRLSWKINSTLILEYTVHRNEVEYFGEFKQKMEFSSTDLSLHIKDLTETDSGVYSAETTDTEGQQTDLKYNLHVQEAVPKPTLKLTLLQLNSSGLSCKVSVNCSVRDSWVSGTCDQVQCSQVQLSPGSDVDLSVKSERGTIFCSGSNGVSRETQSEPVEYPCFKNTFSSQSSTPQFFIPLTEVGVLLLCAVGLVIKYRKRRRLCYPKTSTQEENTAYTSPEELKPHHGVNGSQETPLTVYSTLMPGSDQKAQTKVPPSCRGGDISMYSEIKR